jgi:inorganic triphosphatase YgiF
LQEIELKLEALDPAGLDAPAIVAAVPGRTGRRARSLDLRAIYFDTTGQALRKAGLSLRIRESGGRWVLTLKAADPDSGIALNRSERECAVAGPTLDPDLIEDLDLTRVLEAESPLESVFEVQVRRSTSLCRVGESRIELSVDAGRVLAGAKGEAFGEVELELKSGRIPDIFALAARLVDRFPLRLSLQTKAGRGYESLEASPPAAVKAKPVALSADASATTAFRIVARSCLAQLLENEHVLLRCRDPEAVHQMRVAIRRLRAALSLFKPVVASPASDTVKEDLRRIGRALGEARDLDVRIAAVQERGQEMSPAELSFLQDAQARRDRIYDGLLATIRSPSYRRSIVATAAWVETETCVPSGTSSDARNPTALDLGSDPLVVDLATRQLSRRWRSTRRRAKRLADMEPEARHTLRKDIKKLRYGMEFFVSLYTGKGAKRRRRKAIKAIEALQDTLGRLNDIAVAERDPTLFPGFPHASADECTSLLEQAEAEARSLARIEPFWK